MRVRTARDGRVIKFKLQHNALQPAGKCFSFDFEDGGNEIYGLFSKHFNVSKTEELQRHLSRLRYKIYTARNILVVV